MKAPECLTLRPLRADDVATIATFADERAGEFGPGDLASELTRPIGRCFGADLDGRCVGYAVIWVIEEQADVINLVVDPRWRRRGVGRALFEYALGALRVDGVSRCTLEVRAGNVAAIELYRKLGFATAQRRANYYSDPPEDALVMHLALAR
ncbi:MAG: ribosomal protein S18-alanine N-acetyltransferase [Myxococcales bacterium]|nr:ribosomal protein S18-alanine N-acetyltransferase [Myxococcales bacterium]